MAMIKREVELVRVNFNLPITLVEKIKEYANDLGISLTSAYTVLLNTAIEQRDLMSQMPSLIQFINEKKENE